jgi:hypothetical protein
MTGIVFDKFDNGLDLRRGASTSEADRLRVLTNCYVTTGKEIKKRPGMTKIATLEAGTVGLAAGLGKLNTFYEGGSTITHANTLFVARKVRHPTPGTSPVARCWYCDSFNGNLYVAIEYVNGDVYHHYLDKGEPPSAATNITDVNCPHGKGVTKASSKIWSVKKASPFDVVRFCKTDDCTNWTAAGDAGFLPVALKQENAQYCYAVGQFRDKLVAFFQDSAQLWTVDTNPTNNKLDQRIYGVGTRYPRSPASFSDDVFFLADQGVRSITVNAITANLQDTDIGSPIDSVVTPSIGSDVPISLYIPSLGQYWLVLGSIVWAYSFSRTSKLAAWSKYTMPFGIDAITVLDNKLYIRNGNDVYRVDDAATTDDGRPIKVEITFPFLDFKKPGVLKMITGMDLVMQGSAQISLHYDPNDMGRVTVPIVVTNDTRSEPLLPVEVCATSVAPALLHAFDEPFKLTAISFFYESLGQQ